MDMWAPAASAVPLGENVPLLLIANVIANVVQVFVAKNLFALRHFTFACTVTLVQVSCSFLGSYVWERHTAHAGPALKVRETAPLALLFAGSSLLANLNLQHNSIVFAEVCRLLAIPLVVLVQARQGAQVSDRVKAALVPLCVGAFIACVTDTQLSTAGSVAGALSVGGFVMYEVWLAMGLERWHTTALHIHHSIGPPAAAALCVAVPFVDDLAAMNTQLLEVAAVRPVVLLMAAGAAAFVSNATMFMAVDRTDMLLFHMVASGRSVLVLVCAMVLTDFGWSSRHVAGMLILVVGVFLYDTVQWEAWKQQAAAAAGEDARESGTLPVRQYVGRGRDAVM